MTLLSIMVVLLLEQYRVWVRKDRLQRPFLHYADAIEQLLNSGERRHGAIAWFAALLPILVIVVLGWLVAAHAHPLVEWVYDVLVLGLLIDFKGIVDRVDAVQQALRRDAPGEARLIVSRWEGGSAEALDPTSLASRAVELALRDLHTHVLAPLFWFCVLPGPSGVVLYVLAVRLSQRWGGLALAERGDFADFAQGALAWLDWIPLRLTALAFAVVGNFEDALHCWRTQAPGAAGSSVRIVLASGAGALGIRLADAPGPSGWTAGGNLGIGMMPDADHLESAEGLIRRVIVLWLGIIALLTLAAWAGQ